MKQRITSEDILELTESQKHSLQGQWAPRRYDLVLANICTDVENEEYKQSEFVLGDIRVFGTSLYLWDLRVSPAHENDNDDIVDVDNNTDGKNTIETDDNNESGDQSYLESASGSETDESGELIGSNKSDFVFYNKEDCYPLLNIGQMIEILQKNNYGDLYFYTTIGIGTDEGSGVGRDGCARDYESPELCDALWECMKEKIL